MSSIIGNYYGYSDYVLVDGVKLYTVVMLPNKVGKFPTIVMRTPYAEHTDYDDEETINYLLFHHIRFLKRGYAVVFQHCRGTWKSEGVWRPYVDERKDTLALFDYIRKQSFYNKQILLCGASYSATINYSASPYADDIVGAWFGTQDPNRYNICYRNGNFKVGLHGSWAINMHNRNLDKKSYTMPDSFNILPFKDFTKTVTGESLEEYNEILKHPNPNDDFWSTSDGGVENKNAYKDIKFPILIDTGFYDIYTGGVFDAWNSLTSEQKEKSALLVSGNDHSGRNCINFKNSNITDKYGRDYYIDWYDYILGKTDKCPFTLGKITYYSLFENEWKTDNFESNGEMEIRFGNDKVSYVYNPYAPAQFNGGLSCNFGGPKFQDKPNSRYDIKSRYSEQFSKNVVVRGKIKGKLVVESDSEDTCFYVRLSITKGNQDYPLRDDITTLLYQLKDYTPNTEVELDFTFDEHSFMISKGEKLRLDVSSSNANNYLRHTNNKGQFSEQTTCKIANNTVNFAKSYIILPTVEE